MVRDKIEPPAFRFSGRTYFKLARIVRALYAAAGRCRQPMVALQRGYIARNVATLVDAPSASQDEIEPLTLDEALRIMRLSGTKRNGTRWSIALALGLRQGEALGLRWQYVDLDAGTLIVRWQLRGSP